MKHTCLKSVQIWSFLWSVPSCICTEYKDLVCKSLYSVQTQENTDQKKTLYLDTFHAFITMFVIIHL